ncbi:MAG: L,D-transpeptidase family protein [Actinomycetota bacterium]
MLSRLVVALLLTSGLYAVGTSAQAADLQPAGDYHDLVPLTEGDAGPAVIRLQYALSRLGMYHGPVTGDFDQKTSYAVRTFHAYAGLEPTYDFAALDWIRLESLPGDAGIPDRWDEPDRVEVDVGRQLLFIVRDGEVAGILPVSTGGGYSYFSDLRGRSVPAVTPHGDFTLRWHQLGWSCLPWCVYKYWGFSTYYGIHGYPSVPDRPVSHGCIRVTLWDARWMEPLLYVGMPLHVWDTPPDVTPQPPPRR